MNVSKFSISLVIPNWNGKHLLEKNLPSIIEANPGVQIIVADDHSSDESVQFLESQYPEIHVIKNMRKQGFASNVNSGVAKATGDIVVLLNTDVRPSSTYLRPLLENFEDPQVFAVGCLDESHESGQVVKRGRGKAYFHKGFFIHEKGVVDSRNTAWVSGGSSAYRMSIWKELGGMNELYNPFYWEDIDLSYRALKAGYKILFENKSKVSHFHEEGKILTEFSKADVTSIVYRNQFIFLWKNISSSRLWLSHLFWTPVRLIQALTSRDLPMLKGYLEAVLLIPQIFKSRLRESKYWRLSDRAIFPIK